MIESIVGRVLWRAAEEPEFRRRIRQDLGIALAEEGFILSDEEMSILREQFEPLQGLSDRTAYERIAALARAYRR